MNYKLEKFWNAGSSLIGTTNFNMNYKLEKFWNKQMSNLPCLISLNEL